MNQFNNIIWNFNPLKGFEGKFNEFLNNLIMELVGFSSDICLVVGLIAAILFVFGWKKGRDVPLLAWGIHLIIQIVGRVLLGV